MSGRSRSRSRPRSAPAPGEGALPAADAATLLRRNRDDPLLGDRPAIHFGDATWSHRAYVEECHRWGQFFLSRRLPDRPFHIGVLADNTPDYLFALGGAGLVGATIVGLNHTRTGEHLLRDITHTDLALLITEPRHLPELAAIHSELPLADDRVVVSRRYPASANPPDPVAVTGTDLGVDLENALAGVPADDPGISPDVGSTWALVFTSGTSSAPKAVICSQKRLLQTGARMAIILGVGPDDVGYVCMPLFHSNAVMVGWAPSIVAGASVALTRRFSASGWLHDIKRHHVTYFNYTGKPLSYIVAQPEAAREADNDLRIAFGNEGSPEVVEAFARRFDVEVIDAFGATEGGLAINRDADPRRGALGQADDSIKVVDASGSELPGARFDASGRLENAEECVGEIVNTAGSGPFEGYYNNESASRETTRNGWYWSGDLGYLDDDHYLYFAGRNADWIRVDGENFPAGPIEATIASHPDVVVAAVYGVPDDQAGDQAMAAVVLRPGTSFDPEAFAAWLDDQADIGPKWRPRYVRVAEELPTTGTNKIVKRTLVHQKFRRDRMGPDDRLYVRLRGDPDYRLFGPEDEKALERAFERAGRPQYWDL